MSDDRRRLHIPVAQPTGGEHVPLLEILATIPPPEFEKCFGLELLTAAQAWYAARADETVRALEKHCPGGYMDALLGSLLQRKACIIRVPDAILGRDTGRWVHVRQALPEESEGAILVQMLNGEVVPSRGFHRIPGDGSNGRWSLPAGRLSDFVVRWFSAPPPLPIDGPLGASEPRTPIKPATDEVIAREAMVRHLGRLETLFAEAWRAAEHHHAGQRPELWEEPPSSPGDNGADDLSRLMPRPPKRESAAPTRADVMRLATAHEVVGGWHFSVRVAGPHGNEIRSMTIDDDRRQHTQQQCLEIFAKRVAEDVPKGIAWVPD